MGAPVAGRAGLGAVGAGHAQPGRDLPGRTACCARPAGPTWPRWAPRRGPPDPGGGERGHGRGGAGQPPAPPPGGLAAARPWPVAIASGVASAYASHGLLARPGSLPAARSLARLPASHRRLALTLVGFVLLLTPTGSLPSPRWRWWARVTAAAPVCQPAGHRVVPRPFDQPYQATENPFAIRGLDGALLVIDQLVFAVTILAVVVGAGSLVLRFRRARGAERQQLRWVALAAGAGRAGVAGRAGGVGRWRQPGADRPGRRVSTRMLPLAIGAAILRYRLYDLDRIISRTLAYGLLTVLLGGGYAGGRPRPRPAAAPRTPAWSWRRRPWPWRRRSSRPAAASSRGRPSLQPAPLRRRGHDRGVQRAAAPAGRPGHPDRRPAGRGAPDDAAHPGLAVAAARHRTRQAGPCGSLGTMIHRAR